MLKHHMKILYVDDSENDVLLMNYSLKDIVDSIETKRVDDLHTLKEQLEEEHWDVIVVDNSFPTLTLLDVLVLLQKKNLTIPIICTSGVNLEETEKLCKQFRAEAFIDKNHLEKFTRCIKKIIERKMK